MFLIQLSVVLADKIDTTVLGFALADPAPGIKAYQVVSKPFVQIRQTGGMLAYLVMPAVASLVAARDLKGLERVKYDGPRLHLGLLVPVTLLAWIYAAPFLDLWVGPEFPGQVPWLAGLLRLFLVATVPLVLAVPAQAAIGMGRIEVIALAALAGAVINLPLSYALTTQIGVAGVIWGTVLTTLVSNLLVPGLYLVRVLELRPAIFLTRTLSAPAAGALALVLVTGALRAVVPADPRGTDVLARSLPLVLHLGVGCLAYLAGYLAAPAGRSDLAALLRALRRRLAPG
jgi:O-antigen/teichoic acid export membrane protein